MTRTPPDTEALRKIGRDMLDRGREQLLADKDLLSSIMLGDAADGSGNTMIAVADGMNDPEAKEALSKMVKGLIAKYGYFYSVSLFDTFTLRLEPNEEDKFKLVQKLQQRGLGLPEIHKTFGIGKLMEQILVSVETVEKCFMLMQEYERDKDGNCINFSEVKDVPGMSSGRMRFFSENNESGE